MGTSSKSAEPSDAPSRCPSAERMQATLADRSASHDMVRRAREQLNAAPETAPRKESTSRFLAETSHPYSRSKKGGTQEFDLRHELHCVTAGDSALELEIGRGKPLEFVAAITGLPLAELTDCRIEKLEVIFKDSPFE